MRVAVCLLLLTHVRANDCKDSATCSWTKQTSLLQTRTAASSTESEHETEEELGIFDELKKVGTDALSVFVAGSTQHSGGYTSHYGREHSDEIAEQMMDALWEDVTSHKIEACFFEYQKASGLSSYFPDKCHAGVSCDNCKYFKVETRVGFDFCQGVSVRAVSEFAVIGPPIEGEDNIEKVVRQICSLDHRCATALPLAEQILEIVAEAGGVDRYSVETARFKYKLVFEMSNGVGGKADVRWGVDICKSGWHCFGGDIAGPVKIGGKLLVCVGEGFKVKVEIGAHAFAATLELEYVSGLDPGFDLTSSNAENHVITKTCMATPSLKSIKQRTDDWLCPYLKGGECDDHPSCYWEEPAKRRKACFATKRWKLDHPNKGDGLCALANKEKCLQSIPCIWATDPCMHLRNCKDIARLVHDIQLHGDQGGTREGLMRLLER